MQQPVTLPTKYYLSNFNKLCDHALTQYSDLLNVEEHNWLSQFAELDSESQCLLVRLLTRKGDWFRTDKLVYQEIPNLDDAIQSLARVGFVELNPTISCRELAKQLFTKPEILNVFELNAELSKKRKEALIEEIENTAFHSYERLPFHCIRLNHAEILDVLQLLFFANSHQDLSQFVLQDLGLLTFENYTLSKETRFFHHRQEIDTLITIYRLKDDYDSVEKAEKQTLTQNLLNQVPNTTGHDYVDGKREQLINHLARDLERQNSLQLAVDWFKRTTLPPSRERRARIYEKLGEFGHQTEVVQEMLTNPMDINEHEVAKRLERKKLRREGIKTPGQVKPTINQFSIELDLSQMRVELAVQQYLEAQGWQVYYTENFLLTGVFGLAFWQAIFATVDGAFINHYQRSPKDMFSPSFVHRRQHIIDSILENIEFNGLEYVLEIYDDKQGIENPFVHWSILTRDLLEKAIKAIPLEQFVVLFKVLLSDLKNMKTGMPDLIAFKQNRYWWVEVKGPGDKLQHNQERWIEHFIRHEIPYSVCYVSRL